MDGLEQRIANDAFFLLTCLSHTQVHCALLCATHGWLLWLIVDRDIWPGDFEVEFVHFCDIWEFSDRCDSTSDRKRLCAHRRVKTIPTMRPSDRVVRELRCRGFIKTTSDWSRNMSGWWKDFRDSQPCLPNWFKKGAWAAAPRFQLPHSDMVCVQVDQENHAKWWNMLSSLEPFRCDLCVSCVSCGPVLHKNLSNSLADSLNVHLDFENKCLLGA